MALRALRAFRQTQAPILKRFAGAFLLLFAAEMTAVALSLQAERAAWIRRDAFDPFDALFWTYYAALGLGFGLLLSTFTRHKLRLVLAVAPVLLVAGPIAQLVIVALALLVVAHAGLNHIERAGAGSLATATGYALIFLGHAVFLLDYHPLAPRNPAGESLHLAGVVLLVIVAYARRR